MRIRICVIALIAILWCWNFNVAADNGGLSVVSVGGSVTIDSIIENADQGTPVMVLILPKITDLQGEDITLQKLPSSTVASEIITILKSTELDVEYLDTVLLGEGGVLHLNCKMKDGLSTGEVHVYAKCFGVSEWLKIGSFEHVGEDDINTLIAVFNGELTGYKAGIDADLEGKNVLKKSSVDVAYYEYLKEISISDEYFIDEFCEILNIKRPEGGFDILTLASSFNETTAWVKLMQSDYTLQVIKDYNSVYWNVPVEDTKFTSLSEDEQKIILSSIKKGGFTSSNELESKFKSELVLSIFRNIGDRDGLEELISVSGTYSSYFETVRNLMASSNLNKYEKSSVYNEVLTANEDCINFTDIENLFKRSIDHLLSEKESSRDGGGTPVSNRTGGVTPILTYTPPAVPLDPIKAIPFNDIKESDWAYEYIKRLYDKNVINGISETEFAPDNKTKRNEFVKIMVGVLGIDGSLSNSVFTDVPVGCYWEPYVMAAYENGLIGGIGEGVFGVSQNITRQDAAIIISRALKRVDKAEITFNDADDISDYAKDGVAIAVKAGIFKGDDSGNFNPKANLTRSEACAILCRLADILKGV